MFDAVKRFERAIMMALVLMMVVVVFLCTIELGWTILLRSNPSLPLVIDFEHLLDLFGQFLLVLIGLELLDVIKAYSLDNVIHVRVVITVAMIAIARKVIVLEVNEISGSVLLGVAAIILALSAAHVALKYAGEEESGITGERVS